MTAFDWLWELNLVCCGFFSTERPKQKVTNSELRRWLDKGAVIINGKPCKPVQTIDKLETLVLFPNSDKRRTTFQFN
jgi:23S rRNA-/tRNA-specific pseudouridylate synthase